MSPSERPGVCVVDVPECRSDSSRANTTRKVGRNELRPYQYVMDVPERLSDALPVASPPRFQRQMAHQGSVKASEPALRVLLGLVAAPQLRSLPISFEASPILLSARSFADDFRRVKRRDKIMGRD